MKILAIDTKTKQPLANAKVQLQVKGKDSGFITLSTDARGYFELDSKYNGQQIASTANGVAQGQWIQAKEGEKLHVSSAKETAGSKTPSTHKE